MATKTVEERLAALEAAVEVIQRHLGIGKPDSVQAWLERQAARFKDIPDDVLEEADRYGREFRQADRPSDEDE
jgi:hypothetical protein